MCLWSLEFDDGQRTSGKPRFDQSAGGGLFRSRLRVPSPEVNTRLCSNSKIQIVHEPHARLSASHHVELTVHNGRHLVSLGSERDNP